MTCEYFFGGVVYNKGIWKGEKNMYLKLMYYFRKKNISKYWYGNKEKIKIFIIIICMTG